MTPTRNDSLPEMCYDCEHLSVDDIYQLEIALGQTPQMKSVSAAFLAKKKG